ncbi:unnamed protein product, partial [Callosobruchus maculatus]
SYLRNLHFGGKVEKDSILQLHLSTYSKFDELDVLLPLRLTITCPVFSIMVSNRHITCSTFSWTCRMHFCHLSAVMKMEMVFH